MEETRIVNTQRLINLIIAADYTYVELCDIVKDALGQDPNHIMQDGSLELRIRDLVSWADKKSMLSELLEGVLIHGIHKRAVREWILGAYQPTGSESEQQKSPEFLDDEHKTIAMIHEMMTKERRERGKELANLKEFLIDEMNKLRAEILAAIYAKGHKLQTRYIIPFYLAMLCMFAPGILYYSDVRDLVGISWAIAYFIAAIFWILAGALWGYIYFIGKD